MKKIVNLLVLGITVILVTSCSQKIIPQKPPEIPVYLNVFQIVDKSDQYIMSMQMYNSSEFSMTTDLHVRRDIVRNGIRESVDSSYPVTYTIPQGTMGRILQVSRTDDDSPDTLYVSFDAKNPNLRFWFYVDLEYSGFRIQEPEDKIITRSGNEFKLYSHSAPERCKLYLKQNSTSGTKPSDLNANGDPVDQNSRELLIKEMKEVKKISKEKN